MPVTHDVEKMAATVLEAMTDLRDALLRVVSKRGRHCKTAAWRRAQSVAMKKHWSSSTASSHRRAIKAGLRKYWRNRTK